MNIDTIMGTEEPKPITASTVAAAASIAIAVARTIQEAGSTPEGPIYAALNANGLNYNAYQKIISLLSETNLVQRRGNFLYWIGPKPAAR